MAKFCNLCGKPLEEGEICSCQAQAQAQAQPQPQPQQTSQYAQQFNDTMNAAATETKALAKRILPIFKNPVDELKSIIQTGDAKLGIEMIIANVVVSFIMLIIAMISVKVKLGDLSSLVQIPYVKIVLGGTIGIAATYFATAGLIFAFSKIFAQYKEMNFAQAVTAVGGKALYDIIVIVLGILVFLFSKGLGSFVLVAGMTFTYLVMIVTYCESVELEGSAKLYVLAAAQVCLIVIAILAYKVVLGTIAESLAGGLTGSLLGGGANGPSSLFGGLLQ